MNTKDSSEIKSEVMDVLILNLPHLLRDYQENRGVIDGRIKDQVLNNLTIRDELRRVAQVVLDEAMPELECPKCGLRTPMVKLPGLEVRCLKCLGLFHQGLSEVLK